MRWLGEIPSSTRWGLNMLLPLAITSGYLIHEIAALSFMSGRLSMKPVAILVAVSALGLSATKSHELETRKYDDETHPYLYAHTQRSFLDFVRLIEARALALGTGKETGIAVFAPENWPLAWYLRDYTKTGYWGEFKTDVNVDMYVGALAQDPLFATHLGGGFDRLGPYNMRGVVELVLYVRKPSPSPP